MQQALTYIQQLTKKWNNCTLHDVDTEETYESQRAPGMPDIV